jgi:hypothetical protein
MRVDGGGNFCALEKRSVGLYGRCNMANIECQKKDITIRDLYPNLIDEQLREAEEHFRQYIELSIRMYRRIRVDPEAYTQFKALTGHEAKHRIQIVQSDPTTVHQPLPET